ncbi:hypothetical protein Cgig2_027425 [Carnegiea gigantea]|uniref:Uncharacterized protein n=1 Tax=Carnegiea gigantea TaxID=171969 RepID=A0A9Q1GY97_9CARY|nr:hypothetical protein Cgig2_027425 [Carnegiea gigantea]
MPSKAGNNPDFNTNDIRGRRSPFQVWIDNMNDERMKKGITLHGLSTVAENHCGLRSRQKRASVFTKSNSCPASSMTEPSGTMPILQESEICDFDFDPCEYLMNSTGGGAISTIHVAPEGRFSCASFEASGYDVKALNLERLIERVLTGFQSMEFSAAIHSDKHMDVGSVKEPVVADGYYLELGKEELCGARGKRIGLRGASHRDQY